MGENPMEQLLESVGETMLPPWIKYTAIVIAAVLAALVLVCLFRALARRRGRGETERSPIEIRTVLVQGRRRKDRAPAGTPAARVRAQYRKFLKLAKARAPEPEAGDTSLDINRKCVGAFDHAVIDELRELYIEARYNGTSDGERARRAKELYVELKKAEEDRRGSGRKRRLR